MNINYIDTNEKHYDNQITTNELYFLENDGLELDYEEIRQGVERAREDIRCGRYTDGRTFIAELKRRFCNE